MVTKEELSAMSKAQLEIIAVGVREALEDRKTWPTRLVFFVGQEYGNWERCYTLDDALKTARGRVEDDLKSEWKLEPDRCFNVATSIKFHVERYRPEQGDSHAEVPD